MTHKKKRKSLVGWMRKNYINIFAWDKKYNWTSYQINLPALTKDKFFKTDKKVKLTITELTNT